jgi:hypothetical protein
MTMDNVAKRIEKTGYHSNLEEAVAMQTWPTPSTMDHIDRQRMRPSRAATNRNTGYLSEAILQQGQRTWPTPTATERSGINPNTGSGAGLSKQMSDEVVIRDHGIGTLSPQWVTWLMGLPLGWVSLDPLPAERYQEWREAMADATWWDEERGLPRVAPSQPSRVDMLKALGNGIVPGAAAEFLGVTGL